MRDEAVHHRFQTVGFRVFYIYMRDLDSQYRDAGRGWHRAIVTSYLEAWAEVPRTRGVSHKRHGPMWGFALVFGIAADAVITTTMVRYTPTV